MSSQYLELALDHPKHTIHTSYVPYPGLLAQYVTFAATKLPKVQQNSPQQFHNA